tara:strand:+ start:976 stop:1110 length:135 start_codon:yes stop_codon:yes gene_type:complete
MATNTITIKYDYEKALKDVVREFCTTENKEVFERILRDNVNIKI